MTDRQPETAAPPQAPPHAAPQQQQGSSQSSAWDARQPFDPARKSPRLAAVLSAVAPGIGQVYVGYYVRGLTIVASLISLIAIANNVPGNIAPAFGFGSAFLWVFNLVDAGRMAALYNHAASGAGSFELPEDFEMPTSGGSIAGGAILLLFGVIAFSNTALGIRLDWLETWWPVFPMAIGLYLVAKGMRERG